MTRERTVLLVVHTGREEATETARRVEKARRVTVPRCSMLSAAFWTRLMSTCSS